MTNRSIGGYLALLFAAFLIGRKSKKNEAAGSVDSACKPYREKDIGYPIGVRIENDNWPPDDSRHKRKEQKYWNRSIGVSIVALIFAGVAASFAGGAYHAAKDQAAQARRQADTAADQEIRSLRAYVIAKEGTVAIEAGKKPIVTVMLENVGQTPVLELTSLNGITLFKYDENTHVTKTLDVDCKTMSARNDARHIPFGKQTFISKEGGALITDDWLQSFVKKEKSVVFAGRVCYKDIYRIIRTTDFCVFFYREPAEIKMGICGIDYSRTD